MIAGHTGLAEDIAAAQVIVTGEGRLDGQSLHGKVVGTLAGLGGPPAFRCSSSPAR